MDITKRIQVSLLIISLISLMVVVTGFFIVRNNVTIVSKIIQDQYPATMSVIDLKFNILEIQYWFTNISATRAERGYKGGFEKAEFHYNESKKIIKQLLKHHKNFPEEQKRILKIQKILKNYYQIGVETANAYIEGGTFYGNEMLNVLNLETQKMAWELDWFLKDNREDLDKGVETIIGRTSLFQIFFFIGIVFIVLLAGITTFSRKIMGNIKAQSVNFEKNLIKSKRLNEQLEAANQELQAAMEELEATNEEYEAQTEELMASQMEIMEKEARFRTMLEQMPLPVVIFKEDGIDYINKAYSEVLGYSLEDFSTIEKVWSYLFPEPEYRKSNIETYKQVMQKVRIGEIISIPLHLVTAKNGNTLEIEAKITRIADLFLTIIYDMTELRKTQKMLIQSEKLTTVGTLAAGMAHEINNPLGVIVQGVQNTLRRISTDNEKNIETAAEVGIDLNKMHQYLERRNILNYLQGIDDAGMRASEIITSMLQFSRKSNAEKTSANINTIIQHSIELAEKEFNLSSRYDFRKIKIEQNFDMNLPEINCYATEIEQVILNLLKNAGQAMFGLQKKETESKITITTSRQNDYLKISLADTGPGISDTIKDHIFEPFFTTKKDSSGTGLGLSICYFIITNNHDGNITVESEEDKGTEFIISLPVS